MHEFDDLLANLQITRPQKAMVKLFKYMSEGEGDGDGHHASGGDGSVVDPHAFATIMLRASVIPQSAAHASVLLAAKPGAAKAPSKGQK